MVEALAGSRSHVREQAGRRTTKPSESAKITSEQGIRKPRLEAALKSVLGRFEVQVFQLPGGRIKVIPLDPNHFSRVQAKLDDIKTILGNEDVIIAVARKK